MLIKKPIPLPSWASRLLGLLSLLVALSGLDSTMWTFFELLARRGIERLLQQAGVAYVWYYIIVNLLDLSCYTALLWVSVTFLRLRSEYRWPGQVLGVYFVVMGVIQPLMIYAFLQSPIMPTAVLAGESISGALDPLIILWGAGLLIVFGALLFWSSRYTFAATSKIGKYTTRVHHRAFTSAGSGAGRTAKIGRRAATNAPRHWPPVFLDQWLPQLPFYSQLAVVTSLTDGLKVREGAAGLALMRSFLYDDGVLRVPIIVDEGGRRTGVFVYPETNAEANAHYSGVRALLREREGVSAVYFAPEALVPVRPSDVLERLDTFHFSRVEEERGDAEYALWWPTDEDPRLDGSPALEHLDVWFEALNGCAHLLFSSFVKELRLTNDDEESDNEAMKVFALPPQALMVPVTGPAGMALYLHASRGEGLWLAFDVAKTAAVQRNRLLSLLAGLATGSRKIVDERKLSPGQAEQGRALEYWRRSRKEAIEKELNGKADLRLGCILEKDAARVRWPGATTAAERDADLARARPDDALTRFASEQLGVAVEKMTRRVKKDACEAGEEPNLHPVVIVRTGEDVRSVTLYMYTEPEAVQACPSQVEGFGEVDIVALVCDGIVRMDGERFDAVKIRAQESGSNESHVFAQRYRLSNRKVELLGNWLLVGNDVSLLPTRSSTSMDASSLDDGPTVAVEEFTRKILATTLDWIRLGDDEGIETYEEDAPLVSPSLYLQIGGETLTRRFMMGNQSWAESAVRQSLREASEARFAIFVYDFMAELNGRHARSLCFRAQERGDAASRIYEQAYDIPRSGRAF